MYCFHTLLFTCFVE